MKRKKEKEPPCERWLKMTEEERDREVEDFVARTKPEDLFPELYQRFVQNIDKMLAAQAKQDQHQTPPLPS